MIGCTYGTFFQVTVAGGSYQEGLSAHIQGVPAGIFLSEEEIYFDLLQRKPGQGELSSPRREPDIPVIYAGVNAADTMTGFSNEGYTNGTPLTILIPNLDRHFEHIEQYRSTNRTPRPGHASYASYQKYGQWDDSIGAGIFSGRYTSTIVAAGAVAKKILKDRGIEIFAFVRERALLWNIWITIQSMNGSRRSRQSGAIWIPFTISCTGKAELSQACVLLKK